MRTPGVTTKQRRINWRRVLDVFKIVGGVFIIAGVFLQAAGDLVNGAVDKGRELLGE